MTGRMALLNRRCGISQGNEHLVFDYF